MRPGYQGSIWALRRASFRGRLPLAPLRCRERVHGADADAQALAPCKAPFLQLSLDRKLDLPANLVNIVDPVEIGQRSMIGQIEAGQFQPDVSEVIGKRRVEGVVRGEPSRPVTSELD